MFTNILVPLDASEVSQRTRVETIDQSEVWHAKIQAVSVAQTPQFNSLPMNESFGIENTYEMNRIKKKRRREERRRDPKDQKSAVPIMGSQ